MASIIFSNEQREILEALTSDASSDFFAGYDYLRQELQALDAVDLASMQVTQQQVDDCVSWLTRASAINQNTLSDAANNFIRDVTRYGMLWDGKEAGHIQSASDAIGRSVISAILSSGEFPSINTIVGNDVQTAINTNGQTLGGWGGAFYYWTSPYPAGGEGASIGSVISADPSELDKFIALASCATYQAVGRVTGGSFDPVALYAEGEAYLEMLSTGWDAAVPALIKAEIVGRFVDYVTGMRHHFSNNPSRWEWEQSLDLSNATGVPQPGQNGFC